MKFTKTMKHELEQMSNGELLEALKEFPKEQKKLQKQVYNIRKEIQLNNQVEFYIKGIFAKRNETKKGTTKYSRGNT